MSVSIPENNAHDFQNLLESKMMEKDKHSKKLLEASMDEDRFH